MTVESSSWSEPPLLEEPPPVLEEPPPLLEEPRALLLDPPPGVSVTVKPFFASSDAVNVCGLQAKSTGKLTSIRPSSMVTFRPSNGLSVTSSVVSSSPGFELLPPSLGGVTGLPFSSSGSPFSSTRPYLPYSFYRQLSH